MVATRMPPSAGPTKIPTLSIVVAVTFAAVSSSGLRARFGTSAAWAGRNAVPITVPTIEMTYTSEWRPPSGDEQGHQREERHARQIGRHHHPDPRVAVSEHPGQRRREARGDPAGEPDQPDRIGPVLTEGIDRDRDRVGPRTDVRARPGQLEAAQGAVLEHPAEGPERLAHVASIAISAAIWKIVGGVARLEFDS